MKRCLPMLLVLFVSASAYAQTGKSTVLKAQDRVVEFFDAISAMDMEALKKQVTDDFMLLEDGEVWSMETLVQKAKELPGVDFKRVNHLDFIRTEALGNGVWTAYRNTADITVNGHKMTVRWLESAVLEKVHGEWKIRLLHSTKIPAAEK